jgi:phosphoadenosine phosphosulfate reductase
VNSFSVAEGESVSETTEQQKLKLHTDDWRLLDHVLAPAENWTAEQVLHWAYETFGQDVAIASAFGPEGIVVIDIAARVWPRVRVFVLDTSFLFPETYRLIEQVEQRYGIEVERVLPSLSPEEQAQTHGSELWTSDPDLCCRIRKVEPLERKLAHLKAWVTAIRREQTPARADARKVEWDPTLRVAKINAIADWTHDDVWNHLRARDLPYNPLHDRNYPSVGCTHCTRAIQPGEAPRSGRWPGFEKRECGIHSRRGERG